jgi:hypothetical protein
MTRVYVVVVMVAMIVADEAAPAGPREVERTAFPLGDARGG